MKNKRIEMANGTNWYVLANTNYQTNEYLLCCDVENVEQIVILKHQTNDSNHLFDIETNEDVLNVVYPILEEMIKED